MMEIFEMSMADHAECVALWQITPGIGLSQSDSPEGIARFLQANPGGSFVARENGELVGTVLCGSDGRRGYLYHLAVRESHRGRGLGRALVEKSLETLRAAGIEKCHIFVYGDNTEGQAFWTHTGWKLRTTLVIMTRDL